MKKSPIEKVLDSLQDFKPTQKNRWLAKCPAHQDDSPSLVITNKPKGVYMHCQAGCDKKDVLAAMGLEMKDLFENNGYLPPKQRKAWGEWKSRRKMEEELKHEMLVLTMALDDKHDGRELTNDSRKRALKAVDEIRKLTHSLYLRKGEK